MCGRYTLRKSPFEGLVEDESRFRVKAPADAATPSARYNIAPTQACLALVSTASDPLDLEPRILRWGLVPSWSKSLQASSPLINARCESATEQPAFRAAYQRRRCLIPADGFYEWRKRRDASLPFFFHLRGEPVFYLAGIWESWQGAGAERVDSFAILTTRANALIHKIHERMPVILAGDQLEAWLVGAPEIFDPAARLGFFEPLDAALMECRPANPAVNNNRNDGPECLDAPDGEAILQMDFGL